MMETSEINYRDRLLDTGLTEGGNPLFHFDLEAHTSHNIGWFEGSDIDILREKLVRFDDFQLMRWDKGSAIDFRLGQRLSVSVPLTNLGRVAHAFDMEPIAILDRCAGTNDLGNYAFLDVPLEGVVFFRHSTFGTYKRASTPSGMRVEEFNELIREAYP